MGWEVGQRGGGTLRKPSVSDSVTKIEAMDSKSSSRGTGKLRKNDVKVKGRMHFHEIKKISIDRKSKIQISESVEVALKKDN